MAMHKEFRAKAVARTGQASRREVLFSFATVALMSALIWALTQSVLRLSA